MPQVSNSHERISYGNEIRTDKTNERKDNIIHTNIYTHLHHDAHSQNFFQSDSFSRLVASWFLNDSQRRFAGPTI